MNTMVFGIITLIGVVLIFVILFSRQFLSRLPSQETLLPPESGGSGTEYTSVLEEKPDVKTVEPSSPEEIQKLVGALKSARTELATALARYIDEKQHIAGEVTYTTNIGEDVISTFEDMLVWIKNAVDMVRGRFDVASTSNLLLKDLFYSDEEEDEVVEDVVANMELVEREEIERMKHHLSNVEKHGEAIVSAVRELKALVAKASLFLSHQPAVDPSLLDALREESSLASSALSDPRLVEALSSLSSIKNRLEAMISNKEKNLEVVDLVRNYIYGLRTLVGIALESLKRDEFEQYLDYAWQDLAARVEAEGGVIRSNIHVLMKKGDKLVLTLVTRGRSVEIENLADKKYLSQLAGVTV